MFRIQPSSATFLFNDETNTHLTGEGYFPRALDTSTLHRMLKLGEGDNRDFDFAASAYFSRADFGLSPTSKHKLGEGHSSICVMRFALASGERVPADCTSNGGSYCAPGRVHKLTHEILSKLHALTFPTSI